MVWFVYSVSLMQLCDGPSTWCVQALWKKLCIGYFFLFFLTTRIVLGPSRVHLFFQNTTVSDGSNGFCWFWELVLTKCICQCYYPCYLPIGSNVVNMLCKKTLFSWASCARHDKAGLAWQACMYKGSLKEFHSMLIHKPNPTLHVSEGGRESLSMWIAIHSLLVVAVLSHVLIRGCLLEEKKTTIWVDY